MPRSMAAIKSGGDGTCSPSLFLSPFPSLHAHRAARPIVSPVFHICIWTSTQWGEALQNRVLPVLRGCLLLSPADFCPLVFLSPLSCHLLGPGWAQSPIHYQSWTHHEIAVLHLRSHLFHTCPPAIAAVFVYNTSCRHPWHVLRNVLNLLGDRRAPLQNLLKPNFTYTPHCMAPPSLSGKSDLLLLFSTHPEFTILNVDCNIIGPVNKTCL